MGSLNLVESYKNLYTCFDQIKVLLIVQRTSKSDNILESSQLMVPFYHDRMEGSIKSSSKYGKFKQNLIK